MIANARHAASAVPVNAFSPRYRIVRAVSFDQAGGSVPVVSGGQRSNRCNERVIKLCCTSTRLPRHLTAC